MKPRKPSLIQRLGMLMVRSGTWQAQSVSDLDRWMDSTSGGYSTSSGALVGRDTAVNFSAFFSGVLQICQTIASCKLYLYRQTGEASKQRWIGHTLERMLTRKVNPHMNSFTWKERMQYHAMVWGNAYCFRQKNAIGQTVALWPLNPELVTPKVLADSSLVYEYRGANGQVTTYRQDEVFHLPGFGFDSVKGYSLLEIARETIGLGLSQQEFTNRFLSNGAHLGGLLTTEKDLSDAARARLRTQFSKFHSGVANSGSFAVLEEGMDYKTLGMPLADAQFLESKIFQIQEIARILNISPYKLKDYSHATFSNIEHLGIEYATDTIRPWAERWEAAIDTQLLDEAEQDYSFVEFDLGSIMRGDIKSQNEAYNVARNGGWMNADEIRYRQGLNPIGNPAVGQMYWRPQNMADAAAVPIDQEGSDAEDQK